MTMMATTDEPAQAFFFFWIQYSLSCLIQGGAFFG